jgi:hypothetical protein
MAGEVLSPGRLRLRDVSGEVQGVILVMVVGLIGQGLVTSVVVIGRPSCRHGRARGAVKKKSEDGEGSWAGLTACWAASARGWAASERAGATARGWAERGEGEKRSGPCYRFCFSFSKMWNSNSLCLFHYEISRAPKLLNFFCETSMYCVIFRKNIKCQF